MGATNEEQEKFLIQLEGDFDHANQLLKGKWDAFLSYFHSNKSNWTDDQYFYFEKRVMEIDQAVLYMNKQIEGPIAQFLQDKIQYLSQHRK